MELLQEMSELLQKGKAKKVKALVQQALDEGIDPTEILNEGLLSGMMIIGGKFKNNEVFVPEVLVAARAMNMGLSILEPRLAEVGSEPVGRAVIGTVRGDLHDIGKNLVCMMFKGAGFEVCDLGVDVGADDFIDKAEEMHADVIGMSALLSTTIWKPETRKTDIQPSIPSVSTEQMLSAGSRRQIRGILKICGNASGRSCSKGSRL